MLLTREVAALLQDEVWRGRFLNMDCGGEVRACECIFMAASTVLQATGSYRAEAETMLLAAPQAVTEALLRFTCGDKAQLMEDGQIIDLYHLAKRLGVDACVNACRIAISSSKDMVFPIILSFSDDDARKHRNELRGFFGQGRLTDVTLRLQMNAQAAKKESEGYDEVEGCSSVVEELRVHRAVLAAASSYFAALWTHDFVEACSPDVVVEVEGTSHMTVPRMLALHVLCLFGIKATVCYVCIHFTYIYVCFIILFSYFA